jgi:2'-hydroxyisoflavone reductase
MKLLVLGGTHHVGRAVVETALARGDDVTTLNRGVSGHQPPGARAWHADRTDPAGMRGVLGDESWDAVIDTWSGAPSVVADAAGLLAGRAAHYGYVSSRSVYTWPFPPGADESAPLVDADPASTDGQDYAAAKRGGELAAVAAFGDRALLARAGLILGPYEGVGRMPWWLGRMERGGDVLAPGRRNCRCSTSTAATWRRGCSAPPTAASAAPSTPSAGAATPRWPACSRRPGR